MKQQIILSNIYTNMKCLPLKEGKTEFQQNSLAQIGPISAKLCFAFSHLFSIHLENGTYEEKE